MDNHPPTILINHSRHNPSWKSLDNPQNSSPGLASNGGLPWCPTNHQRVANPQQLQTLFASYHISRNSWSHQHKAPLTEVTLNGSTTPSLQWTSSSWFNWPTQPAPGKSAWTLWTKTIKALYLKPGMSTQFKKPLGPWYPQATKVWRWYTTYNPNTKAVLLHVPHQPLTWFPIQTTMQTHNYYMTAQPTNNPPALSYPITTKPQWAGFRTTTMAHLIPHQPISPINPIPTNLWACIKKLLPTYTPELWHQLTKQPGTNNTDLAEYITNKKGWILLVSNASLNTQQHSIFLWTISPDTTELWTGSSTSPSTQHDAFLGRSEGYKILAAIMFL